MVLDPVLGGAFERERGRGQLGWVLEERTVAGCPAMCDAGISDSGSALRLIQLPWPTFLGWELRSGGLVRQGISTVVGCPAVCSAGISISGSTDVADADRDILEDSLDARETVREPLSCEVNQETVGSEEIGVQN